MPKTETETWIDVSVMDATWHEIFPNIEAYCIDIIRRCSEGLHIPNKGEVSIALMDDAHIQSLNAQFRGKDTPTNVLSFPNHGPAPVLGDITIARETTQDEAVAAGISLCDHFTHLLIHGFMHLHGYDHENDTDAHIMETLEIKALTLFNIDNPYKFNERPSDA